MNIVKYLVGKKADINIKDNNGVNICEWTVYLFFVQKEKLLGFEVVLAWNRRMLFAYVGTEKLTKIKLLSLF